MRRAVCLVERLSQFPDHGGVSVNRANRLPPDVGQRGQPVISAENIAGAVDQIEMFLGHEWGLGQVEAIGNDPYRRW